MSTVFLKQTARSVFPGFYLWVFPGFFSLSLSWLSLWVFPGLCFQSFLDFAFSLSWLLHSVFPGFCSFTFFGSFLAFQWSLQHCINSLQTEWVLRYPPKICRKVWLSIFRKYDFMLLIMLKDNLTVDSNNDWECLKCWNFIVHEYSSYSSCFMNMNLKFHTWPQIRQFDSKLSHFSGASLTTDQLANPA